MIAASNIAWPVLLPVLVAGGFALAVLLVDLWMEGPDREGLGWIGIVGLIVTAITAAALWNTHLSTLSGAITLDRFGLFFTLLFCLTSVFTLLMSMSYLEQTEIRTGDYYSLVMFATVGMMLMASATDLLVIFLGLEVMSIAAYALAGIARSQARSNEAAMKYFLLGAFASGFFLYGIALVFGATGSTNLDKIAAAVAAGGALDPSLVVGAGLLVVGFGFKISAVPFHLWTSDVYEGAPTSITAFIATGSVAGDPRSTRPHLGDQCVHGGGIADCG